MVIARLTWGLAVAGSVLLTNAASRRVLEKAGLLVHCEIDHGEHIEVIYRITQ